MEQKKYCYKYPRPAVTTDNVIFSFDDKDLNILLIKRRNEPFKDCWAFPGGFINMNETLEQCAKRELEEETGFKAQRMEQLMSFSSVDRDPRERVITVAFFALVRMQEVKGSDDAAEAKWFKLKDVPHLAFDHDYILRIALNKLKERVHFEPICFEILPKEFTMTELQRLYEAILGVSFDRRNFFRKMISWGILDRVDNMQESQTQNTEQEDFTLDFSNSTLPVIETKKSKRIKLSNLFSKDSDKFSSIQEQPTMCYGASADMNAKIDKVDLKTNSAKPKHNSRIAYRYTFNKERYEQKKNEGFKLEF